MKLTIGLDHLTQLCQRGANYTQVTDVSLRNVFSSSTTPHSIFSSIFASPLVLRVEHQMAFNLKMDIERKLFALAI